MALDLYSPCPCGSGKKFKWCCQPIHEKIGKAYEQDANGQHEAALRTMDEVAAEHAGNPEVWGRKAQLLYQLDKPEEAETALQKAFDINPHYPFGYFLKGKFRQYEGEIAGALILFRKAAELYDPEARGLLAQLHGLIADCEMQLNRPVAARAALEIARRCQPEDPELTQEIQAFNQTTRFPQSARQEYKFQPPSAPPSQGGEGGVHAQANEARQAAWQKALGSAGTGKLSDAAAAFVRLTAEDAGDAAAWYNLGLCRAWQGDHLAALEALDRYVALEADQAKAAAAWALAEVLRCGQGMEDYADYVGNSLLASLRDPQQFVHALNELGRQRRLLGVEVDQENGVVTGLMLEKVQALTAEVAAQKSPRLAAGFMLAGNMLRLWNMNRESLDTLFEELRQRLGPALNAETHRARTPISFAEVLSDAVVFPVGLTEEAEAHRRMTEHYNQFMEETWLHRPLKSLNQTPPLDAAGHPLLRKKLRGVIQFLEECAAAAKPAYDFDRLRRKLGLLESQPPEAGSAPLDIAALGAAELAGLAADSLTDAQAEQAYQTAVRLDARDLAGKFAQVLVRRPARPERPDRFPWFAHLVQQALAQNDAAAALDYLNEGEKDDCAHNEGRRRNDYELRRGQIHAKRGNIDQAQDVFDGLIARMPAELKYRTSAAEAMLSARQGARARRFAEAGLTLARQQNNRDSEDHFKELLAAAQKQGG